MTLWQNLIPKTILKHETITKILRWLPWFFLQGINPMGLNDPYCNSYPNNCSAIKNCNQNLDIIALKNCKVLTQWALVPLWLTLISTNVLKNETVTKNLRWSTWNFQGMNSMGFSAYLPTLIPKFVLKHQTVTKILIWLPRIHSTNLWWQV